MTDILRDLIERVRDLKETVQHSMPAFRWGVVTSVSPLAVQLDADTQPLAGSPTTLTTGLHAGDRVLCLQVYRKVTILGVLKGGDTGWILGSYSSPFSDYNGTTSNRPKWRRINGVTYIQGVTTAPANTINNNSNTPMFTLPAGFRPTHVTSEIMQGSSNNRWQIIVNSNGEVAASRYGPDASQGDGVWLPFSLSFPADL